MDSGAKSSAQLHNELKEAVKEISENTDQKLVGVGLLSDAVSRYYENNLPNVTVEEMAETLGELLREVIENY
jgi:cobalamin biosynthesis protein CobT